MNKKTKLTALEKHWILYDIGNSAFTLLVSTLIPIYFNSLASSAGVNEDMYLSYWGYAGSISTILVAFIAPICGTMSDRRADTFYGGYHLLIEKLYQRYPNAQIIIMTPLHRMSEDETDYNELGVRRVGSLADYADAIKEVAGYYGIPVWDAFRCSGMQPRLEALREKYMPDGLHPNDEGHALLAQRLLTVLNAI